ncbi:MAG: YdcH family protein [Mesorhizobium sp.]
MSDQEQAEIRLEFARLKQEHADFDAAINAMIATGCDPLQIQRMKKKKLAIKDKLTHLEDRVIPDIIA